MLDNQAFALKADVSVASLALQIVDAYGRATKASCWRGHDWRRNFRELRRLRYFRWRHFLKEAENIRIAGEDCASFSSTPIGRRDVSRSPIRTSRRSGSWHRMAPWWRFGREEFK